MPDLHSADVRIAVAVLAVSGLYLGLVRVAMRWAVMGRRSR